MRIPPANYCYLSALALAALALNAALAGQDLPHNAPSIVFELKKLPFRLESDVTPAFNPPETMAGGVAVFDYNGDGRPDIFFTNGADLATLFCRSSKVSTPTASSR